MYDMHLPLSLVAHVLSSRLRPLHWLAQALETKAPEATDQETALASSLPSYVRLRVLGFLNALLMWFYA